jgi:ADP-ribosylation factor-like protein 2
VVWVVDSWDAARLQDCRDELHRLLQEERLLGASLLVLANKQDLEGALTAEEIAARLDLAGLAGSRHVEVRAASARTGQGLANGFRWLLQDISQRIFFLD